MKVNMVILSLLLMEVKLNFGHTLSKIELKNETDIYEVKEDQSALLITHPKDEATKLREIVYYHIIERPYDAKDITHDKIESDFEKRLFTNSHSGIQFEKNDFDDDDDQDESTSEEIDDDSSNSEETDGDINSSESDEEKDNEKWSDKNDLSKDKINDQNKLSSNRYGDNDSINNNQSDVDSPIDADSIQIDIRSSDFVVNTTEGRIKVESARTKVTADPETETEGITESPQSRSKRDINHTATGKAKSVKTGGELNHPNGKTPKSKGGTYGMSLTGNRGVVWNDVKPAHIEYHVGEPDALTTPIPDVLAEYITTSESAKEPVVIQEIGEDNQGDGGGDDDNDEEEIFIETFAEIEKIFDKLIDNMDKTNKSESKQEKKTDGGSVKSKGGDDNKHDNGDSILAPIEIEKSFIEIFKVFKELTGNNTSNPAVTNISEAIKSRDDADISEENVSGESSTGDFLTTTKEDKEVANDTPIEIGVQLAPKRIEKDNETSYKENDIKQQQQFVKELLKNKYLWAWLKDASASYLEILTKKMDAVIKTEVEKQFKHFLKEHKNENCKEDKVDQNNAVQEQVQSCNVTDENLKVNISDIPTSTDHNGLALNDTTAESINDSNETSSEISIKKHKDKPSNDNAESSVKIEAQNLFGSSVGSGKVTNIFIYNTNKAFDLENIKTIKNDTNGVFVLGLDDKKPVEEKEEVSDKGTIHEVETVKPDITSEHNNTVDKVLVADENQTSIANPAPETYDQSNVKDKIKDKDRVKDEDSVEHSTVKNEVMPNDLKELETSTKANNHDKTSTEINREESSSTSEKPLEGIQDNKQKDAKTEK